MGWLSSQCALDFDISISFHTIYMWLLCPLSVLPIFLQSDLNKRAVSRQTDKNRQQ